MQSRVNWLHFCQRLSCLWQVYDMKHEGVAITYRRVPFLVSLYDRNNIPGIIICMHKFTECPSQFTSTPFAWYSIVNKRQINDYCKHIHVCVCIDSDICELQRETLMYQVVFIMILSRLCEIDIGRATQRDFITLLIDVGTVIYVPSIYMFIVRSRYTKRL